MKLFFKIVLLTIVAGVLITSCDKEGNLPFYVQGTTPALTVSTTTVAPAPGDSDNVALTVNWTNPNYATAAATVKYVVQVDSAGRNFAHAVSKTVTGDSSVSFTAKELNSIALGFGFAFNTAYSMDVRLISSYANNNDQQISNTVTIQYTPYKVPPKVPLPASGKLFLVGSATQGGWANPVPVPSQEFAQLDETTWAGVFQLNGGSEYLILPENGSWDHKYAVADKSVTGLSNGGEFGYDFSDNFPGPASSGLYVITLNFQSGMFTVTPYTGTLPANLYIVGDATNGGWNNPVPVPSQEFTRLNSAQFEITVDLIGGKQYLLLPVNGDWSHKFAVDDPGAEGAKTAGNFMYDASSNFPGPDESGSYKIEVNFIDNTYKLTKL